MGSGRRAPKKQVNRTSNRAELRIIGGTHRGRKFAYAGDPRTRPMKERTREAIYNLLGPAAKQKHAVDLFAGTGALGLEALSRGARDVTLIERHYPTSRVIQRNAASLELDSRCTIIASDTFFWSRNELDLPTDVPWLVFCSPPYDLYVDQREEMLALIARMSINCPPESLLVIEADSRFQDRQFAGWELRQERRYSPAWIGIYRFVGDASEGTAATDGDKSTEEHEDD